MLLRSGAGPQQISIDSCCCCATCGQRKFSFDYKEFQHAGKRTRFKNKIDLQYYFQVSSFAMQCRRSGQVWSESTDFSITTLISCNIKLPKMIEIGSRVKEVESQTCYAFGTHKQWRRKYTQPPATICIRRSRQE